MLLDLTLKINPKNAATDIAKLGHYGTHIDLMEKDTIPLEHFITTAKLIDIHSIRDRIIELKDIENNITINQKDFIIFRSYWLKDYGYGTYEYAKDHPQLADDVIDYLIDKKVSFIGLDFMGAQRHKNHIAVDNKCAENGIYIIENLDNLDLINQNCFRAYCFPMNLMGSTGVPIRVIAEL